MTERNRPRTEATNQIACLSCGYRRAWPTMLEAVADGHRHHAEPASCESPAVVTPVPAMRDTTGDGRSDPNA